METVKTLSSGIRASKIQIEVSPEMKVSWIVTNTINNGENLSLVFPRKDFKTLSGAEKYANKFLNS